MSKIPTLREICRKLDCQEKTKGGICWFECNTKVDKTVIIFHGVTGGKIDMMPLAERYVGFGYAVYSVDLPGHGGSVRPELNSYDDLSDWLMRVFGEIGRMPDLIISNSFASSIVYHALRTGKIPQKTKVILACPTPDPSNLADVLQKLSNRLPDRFGWNSYNSKVARIFERVFCSKPRKKRRGNGCANLKAIKNPPSHYVMLIFCQHYYTSKIHTKREWTRRCRSELRF